jgi:hypothetical protein
MSAVLLDEIADELECAGMDEYAERLRFWDRNMDELGVQVAHLREALALRVPADPPEWQQGGQQTVWIWDEEDREHRALLGDVRPCGGSVPSQRPDRGETTTKGADDGSD